MRRMHDDKEVVSSVKVEDNNLIVENAAGNVNTFPIQGGGATYTAGNGIAINDENVISADTDVMADKTYVDQSVTGLVATSEMEDYVGEQLLDYVTIESYTDDMTEVNNAIQTEQSTRESEISRVENEIPDVSGFATIESVNAVSETAQQAANTANNALEVANGKQDKLTAGENITISEDNVISAAGGSDYTFTNGLTETDGTVSMAGVTAYTNGSGDKYPTWVIGYDDGVKEADISKVKYGGIHFYDFYQNGRYINLSNEGGAFVALSTSGFDSTTNYTPNIGGNAVVVGRASKARTKCGYSSIIGFEESVEISGLNTLAVGRGLKSTKFNASSEAFLGKYNIDNTGTANIFVIGNGTSDTARHNAFAVGSDNSITIGDTTLTEAQLQALLASGSSQDIILSFNIGGSINISNKGADKFVAGADSTAQNANHTALTNWLIAHNCVDYASGLPMYNTGVLGTVLYYDNAEQHMMRCEDPTGVGAYKVYPHDLLNCIVM